MKTARETVSVECPKCSGKGRLTWAGHVDNGKCFTCWGSGTVEIDAELVRASAESRAINDAERWLDAAVLGVIQDGGEPCASDVRKCVDALLAAGSEKARARVMFWRDTLDLSKCYGKAARPALAAFVRAVIAEGRARRVAA
jgi:hypothetical protein